MATDVSVEDLAAAGGVEFKVFRDSSFSDLVDANADVAVATAQSTDIFPLNLGYISGVTISTLLGQEDLALNGAETCTGGREFSLEAVDVEGLYDTIRQAMQRIAASAYIHGRIDQVADYAGSNAPRLVRARDLRRIIEVAIDDDFLALSDDPRLTATWFKLERGKLKEVNGAKE